MEVQHSSSFPQRVYAVIAGIPCGKVASYGLIALLAGNARGARAVARCLHNGPRDLPYYRIVNQTGQLPPSDIFGGLQRQMLEQEGVAFLENGRVDIKIHMWDGKTAEKKAHGKSKRKKDT